MTSSPAVTAALWAAPRPGGLWQIMGAWRHHTTYAEAPIGDPQPHQVAADVIRWRRAQPFHYRPPRQFRTRTPRKARAMPTYTASISRDDSDQLTLSRPEDAPDWVSELVDDVVWKFEESPDARSVSLTIQAGGDQTQAGTTTTTGSSASEVLTADPTQTDPAAQPTAGTDPTAQPEQTAGDTAAAGQAPPPGAQTTSPGDPGTPEATAGTGPGPAPDTTVETAAAAPEAGDGTAQPPPAGTTGDVPGSTPGTAG